MWPWGHAAVGYLAYLGVERLRGRRAPRGRPVLAALVGTQLPDLVDKPLAWSLGLLPTGRSLAHSLFVAGAVLGVLWLVAGRARRAELLAFGVGWVSHALADGLLAVAEGAPAELTYLLWPLFPLPAYATEPSFVAHFRALRFGPYMAVQVALCAVALAAWYRRRTRAPPAATAEPESS